jgi:hypothetical protein
MRALFLPLLGLGLATPALEVGESSPDHRSESQRQEAAGEHEPNIDAAPISHEHVLAVRESSAEDGEADRRAPRVRVWWVVGFAVGLLLAVML